MKRAIFVLAALALALSGRAEEIKFTPASGGGTATAVTPGVTTITGCTNKVLLADGSSTINCDTDLTYDGSANLAGVGGVGINGSAAYTIGADAVTNGTFTGNATGWTLGLAGGAPDWAYNSNNVNHGNGGGTATLEPSTPLTVVAGHLYRVQFTLSSWSAGTVTPSIGGTSGAAVGQNGTVVVDLLATTTGNLKFTPTTTLVTVIDTISVKEITGSGLTVSASRTTLQGQTAISGPDAPTNVEIGSTSNDANGGTGGTSVVIGNLATNSGNGAGSVCVGNACTLSTTGVQSTAVGGGATVSGSTNNCTIMGFGATCTGPNSVGLGVITAVGCTNCFVSGANNVPKENVYFGEGETDSTATAFETYLNGTGGTGSDNAGANINLAGGRGTGTAAGGDVSLMRSPSIATGSTQQSRAHAFFVRSQKKALTAATATPFARINLASGVAALTGWTGGTVFYTLVANDASDFQSRSGHQDFSIVNKAGAETCAFGTGSTESIANSSGTTTLTFDTDVAGPTNGCDLRATGASSLTETTLALFYSIVLNGPGTVTPQ